jgi:hypothetical protein
MTIPGAPLPRISSLLKACRAPFFQGEPWFNKRPEFLTRLYRHGRLALAAGIDAVRRSQGAASVIVWLPDYFCNEALEPLRRLPVRLKFYPIQEDLTPSWPRLEEAVSRQPGVKVLVLVHYFGFPNAGAEARNFCDRHGMTLLEDAAHLLRPHAGLGMGDILIFSPRKLLAVPAGGILVIPRGLEPYLEEGSRYPAARDAFPWVCLRLAQKLLLRGHLPWHGWRQPSPNGRSSGEPPDYQPLEWWSCDRYTLKLLKVAETELNETVSQRRRNFLRLAAWMDGLARVRPLFPRLLEEICPYAFPLLVEGGLSNILSRLWSAGIPASQWPVFPPEVLAVVSEHRGAIRTRERLMLLPVHQSLSLDQIDLMGQQVRRALTGT